MSEYVIPKNSRILITSIFIGILLFNYLIHANETLEGIIVSKKQLRSIKEYMDNNKFDELYVEGYWNTVRKIDNLTMQLFFPIPFIFLQSSLIIFIVWGKRK